VSMKMMTATTVPSEPPSGPSQDGREDSDDDCEHADDDVHFVVC
jgi:hypothetical protein